MAIFEYRARGKTPFTIDMIIARDPPSAGPWLELEAESYEAARRALAELSAETGFVYESRVPVRGG